MARPIFQASEPEFWSLQPAVRWRAYHDACQPLEPPDVDEAGSLGSMPSADDMLLLNHCLEENEGE